LSRHDGSILDLALELSLGLRVEEILDLARSEEPLVDSKGGPEFLLAFNLDCVEQPEGKGLAVVGDEIVGWAFVSDGLDHSLA
jgi:hypothetical protein